MASQAPFLYNLTAPGGHVRPLKDPRIAPAKGYCVLQSQCTAPNRVVEVCMQRPETATWTPFASELLHKAGLGMREAPQGQYVSAPGGGMRAIELAHARVVGRHAGWRGRGRAGLAAYFGLAPAAQADLAAVLRVVHVAAAHVRVRERLLVPARAPRYWRSTPTIGQTRAGTSTPCYSICPLW